MISPGKSETRHRGDRSKRPGAKAPGLGSGATRTPCTLHGRWIRSLVGATPVKTKTAADSHRICQPGEGSDNIKIDPEFAGLLPPPSPGELANLHRSLAAEGCRDALILWKGKNTLIDGHNRLLWCRENKKPFPVVEREFDDRDAAKAYIIHAHLGRRNFSALAESYLRGKRYLEVKRQGERTDLDTSGQSDQKSTAEQLGEEFKVGEKTIRRDAKVVEAVDKIVEVCGGEARNLLLGRDTGLTRAKVVHLAEAEPQEQKEFVQVLKEGGKLPGKARKGKKPTRLLIPRRPKALVQALLRALDAKELAAVSKALAEAVANQGKGKGGARASDRAGKRKGRAAR